MIKETKTTKEVITTHKYCDVCGEEMKANRYCGTTKCEMCGKDLCRKCIGHEIDTCGDYWELYCKSCWDMGESYRLKIVELENNIDKLNQEWLEKCQNNFFIP